MKNTEGMESMPDCQEHFYSFRYIASLVALFWLTVLAAIWYVSGWTVIVSIGNVVLYILAGIAIAIFLLDFLSRASSAAKKDIEVIIYLRR